MQILFMPVKVKHIVNTYFSDPYCCPMAKAAREKFHEAKQIFEQIEALNIDGQEYEHYYFGIDAFNDLRELADKNINEPEKIIKHIQLTKK